LNLKVSKGGVGVTPNPLTSEGTMAMQIICKKAFLFQDTEIVKNPTSGENVAIVKRKIMVQPKVTPQTVPDWIRNDGLFELAIQDDSITEVVVVSKVINSQEKAQPAEDTGTPKTPSTNVQIDGAKDIVVGNDNQEPMKTGWGAQVPMTGLNK
jgi:hypothetical protein